MAEKKPVKADLGDGAMGPAGFAAKVPTLGVEAQIIAAVKKAVC